MASTHKYTLPALPYAYDALEPYISHQIMTLHHDKHHQAYVNNLNAATASHVQALEKSDVQAQIALQQAIKFNGGGHINHSLFWANLAPASSPSAKTEAAPKLMDALAEKYGSYEKFQDEFNAVLLGLQGSGWGWLVKKKSGELDIVATKVHTFEAMIVMMREDANGLQDQDPVVGAQPVFGVDMWEHAYYIQYFNDKASYVTGIWNVINWEESERRFLEQVGQLKL
ncbi:hypothetical protein Q9L58_002626 [Maublancomyces gigas]|uniref:Superoxide dismutase n=1 Tax=Discina gigas TaxID=1032678 RepID=A0ABR3GQY9_9PEZI